MGCPFNRVLWVLETNNIDDLFEDMPIITDNYINIKKITNKAIDELRDKHFLMCRKIDKDTDIDIKYLQ